MLRLPATRLLSVLVVPAAIALTVTTAQLPRQPYTGMALLSDRVMSVDPDSPAERAGVRPGDRIAEFTPAPGLPHLGPDPHTSLAPGEPVVLTRLRGGSPERIWLVPTGLPESERRLHTWLLVVAAGFLVLGGWVWAERRDELTRVFWLLCLAFAVVLGGAPTLRDALGERVIELASTAAQLAIPALFVHFFALFPAPRSRRTPAVARIAWTVVGLLYAGWLVAALVPLPSPARFYDALQLASGVALAVGVLTGLTLFFAAFARHPDRDARRRLRVALAGTILGAAPFALVVLSRSVAPGLPVPGERWSVLATLLVPASFAWAIAVHRVFDFRVALRAAAVLAGLALAALAVSAFANAMGPLGLPRLGEGAVGAAIAALVYAAGRVGPARRALAQLGARVVPIGGEMALDAWRAPAEEGAAVPAERVLESACEAVMRALRLDGCAAVRTSGASTAVVAHAGARHRPQLSRAMAEFAAHRPGPVSARDGGISEEDREALEFAGVRWVLGVPCEPGAALLLGRRLTGDWLDEHERHELGRFAAHLAVALENAELRREARSRSALDRSLEAAHDIQVRRLPRQAPVFPTLDCAAASLSTEAVGGDFYDFLQDGPRAFTLAVGDAAGHGVPAALVQAGVQARFRDAARRARGPAEVLAELNRELVAIEQPEKFMGLLCARVDVGSGLVRLANAGLTPPLVRRADGRVEELAASGLLLGVSALARYESVAVELGPGDVLIAYTDGLTEAARGDRLFGPEGVRAVLDRHAHRRAADLVDELLHAAREWADSPMDDVTLVVLKQVTSPPAARVRIRHPALKLEPVSSDNSR